MKSSKIIWGVDPFEMKGPTLKNTVRFLTHLSAKTGFPVEPVYVASPLELRMTLEFSLPREKRFQVLGMQQMNRFLKQVPIPHLLSPKILVQPDPSISESVSCLVKHVSQAKESLVVMGTHARKGISRFFLGSFVETLLFCHQVPVILINPLFKNSPAPDKILFPTDLSKESKAAFTKLCDFASRTGAKIILYHVLEEAPSCVPSGIMMTASNEIERDQKMEMERLVQKAKKQGVETSTLIGKSRLRKHEAILAQSKKSGVGMVALAAESGKMATTFLGSTTRKIVRESLLPVWVYRPAKNGVVQS